MVRRGTDGSGRHGWANNWYFHQPELDAALRAGVTRFANVEVRLRHEARAVRDAGDHASVDIRNVVTGASDALTARYVVGCDGARSLVRDAIGASMRDLGLHQPWLVVDVVASPRSEQAKRLPDYTVQHCDPRRPMTRVHVKGLRHRWEIMLMPGDDEEEIVRPERIWPMLAPHGIGPDDVRIERSAIYTFHSLVAAPWRRGRLMLAGDSVHQTPALPRAGHVRRDPGRLQPRLEALDGGVRRGRRVAARYLRDGARPPRAGIHRARRSSRRESSRRRTRRWRRLATPSSARAARRCSISPSPGSDPGSGRGTRRRAGMCSLSRGSPTAAASTTRWATGSRCSPPFRSMRGPAAPAARGAGAASASPSSMPRDRPSRSGWPRVKRRRSSCAPDRYVFALARDQADVPARARSARLAPSPAVSSGRGTSPLSCFARWPSLPRSRKEEAGLIPLPDRGLGAFHGHGVPLPACHATPASRARCVSRPGRC